jgi:hypothetical protein
MRQLDDGIGDTLVLPLKGLRRALAVPTLTLTRPRHHAGAVTDRHGRQIDGLSRCENGLGRTSFHGAQYKGIADTMVQLIRRNTSGVIVGGAMFRQTGLAAALGCREKNDEHY